MENVIKYFILLAVCLLAVLTWPSKADELLQAQFSSATAQTVPSLGKMQVSWTVVDNNNKEFRISGTCYKNRNPIWTYNFPGYNKVQVDGLALVLVAPGQSIIGLDLEEAGAVRVVYDTNYELTDSVDMSSLVTQAPYFGNPDESKFVWVAYRSTQDGTHVVATTPIITPEQAFGKLALLADLDVSDINPCDVSDVITVYKRG